MQHSNPPTSGLLMGQSKLMPQHWKRLACVYIRQSTVKQVERNRESQVNQYHLASRAEQLGWSPERIRVIDADLGLSAKTSTHRSGFKELVAEVSLGHVGIIFGYEVSRLARNNSDWYHLLDLAAVFGTLIADNDGIYDPRSYNDRLLLGLKGTMSEAELHLLRMRLDAGRLSQVERGVYRQNLPTGLLRLDDGTVVKDPDDGVRHTIELVFAQFAQRGSCRQVAFALRQAGVLLPRRQTAGFDRGQLLWKQATDAAVYEIVQNPAYAGAFVYGRRPGDPARRMVSGRTIQVRKPREEWMTIQHDVYPAYITWEQYMANQERLQRNATDFTARMGQAQGAARQGAALLQGLVVCGVCGHHLNVAYKPAPRYFCNAHLKRLQGPVCISVSGASLEAVVVQAFFEALQPAQLDALDAVLAAQEAERARLLEHWDERIKRAQYAAHLAQRQYHAVDPDNRLVAGELERRWEAALRELSETQEAYTRFQATIQPTAIPPHLREQFRHISATLPDLWHSGQLSNAQKKELLRALIKQVIIRWTAADTIEVRIVWVSGHYSVVVTQPPIHRLRDLPNYERLQARLHDLWESGLTEELIAAQLSREGFHSARATDVRPDTVRKILLRNHWQSPGGHKRNAPSLPGYLSVREVADRLNCETHWVYRQIETAQIDTRYLSRHPRRKSYLIQADPDLLADLQQRRQQTEELGAQRLTRKAMRQELPSPVKEV